jgi:hypothetical protein
LFAHKHFPLLADAVTVDRLRRPLADKGGNINQLGWTGKLDNVTRPSYALIENGPQIRQRVEVRITNDLIAKVRH